MVIALMLCWLIDAFQDRAKDRWTAASQPCIVLYTSATKITCVRTLLGVAAMSSRQGIRNCEGALRSD